MILDSVHLKRTILFSTNESLRLMARSRFLSMDATFHITPKGWYQTLIIGAEITRDVMVPVAFILMPHKDFDHYMVAFNAIISNLKSLGLSLSASCIMTDFESGLRKAIIKCFPDIALKVTFS